MNKFCLTHSLVPNRLTLVVCIVILCCKISVAQETIVDDRCINNRHISGEWVVDPNKQKSFQCCGWGREDYKWNAQVCGNMSYENDNHIHRYSGSTTGSTQAGASSCDCDAKNGHRTTVGVRDSYVWKPLLCNFKPFNGEQFCKLLGLPIFQVVLVPSCFLKCSFILIVLNYKQVIERF